MNRIKNRWAITNPRTKVLFLCADYTNASEVAANCPLAEDDRVIYIPKDAYHPDADRAFTAQLLGDSIEDN